LRDTLRRVFEPVLGALLAKNWIKEVERAKELTGVGRSIQKEPYRPDLTNRGGFGSALKMDPKSDDMQRRAETRQDAMQVSAGAIGAPAVRSRMAKALEDF
jgi:hypothetical protein